MAKHLVTMIIRLIIFAALIISASAHGHEGRPLFIEIEQQSDAEFKLNWRLPPPLQGNNAPSLRIINESNNTLCKSSSSSLQLGPQFIGNRLYYCPMGISENSSATPSLRLALDYGRSPPNTAFLLRLRNLEGTTQSQFYSGSEQEIVLDFQSSAANNSLLSYLQQGVEHIAGGYDHLLFVACLIFIAGSLRRTLITISGFTVAHSITLGLASFGYISVPIFAIETCIALSIAYLAAEIINNQRSTLTWRHPALVALLFGLLHGFGFASALSEIGLPDEERIPALLLFNLGVELGQIGFVLVFLPLLSILKKITSSVSTWVAYIVGCLAMFWTLQRLLM